MRSTRSTKAPSSTPAACSSLERPNKVENNSQLATPVNLQGTGPGGTPVQVTLDGPLPVPVAVDTFTVESQGGTGGSPALVGGQVLSGVGPVKLRSLTGYCSDPDEDAQYFVQLHDAAAAPLAPGANPLIVIPLRGGFQVFSIVQGVRFTDGIVVALSTTAGVFTAAASPWLIYYGIVGLEP